MRRCTICEKEKSKGVHVYTSFICVECECEIMRTDPGEPRYNYYVMKLRDLQQSLLYS